MLFIEQITIFVCAQGNLILVVPDTFVDLPCATRMPGSVLHPEHSLEVEIRDELVLTAFEYLVFVAFAFFDFGKLTHRVPTRANLEPVFVPVQLGQSPRKLFGLVTGLRCERIHTQN